MAARNILSDVNFRIDPCSSGAFIANTNKISTTATYFMVDSVLIQNRPEINSFDITYSFATVVESFDLEVTISSGVSSTIELLNITTAGDYTLTLAAPIVPLPILTDYTIYQDLTSVSGDPLGGAAWVMSSVIIT